MATARPRHLAVDDVCVWHAVRAIVVVLATTEAVFSAWVALDAKAMQAGPSAWKSRASASRVS